MFVSRIFQSLCALAWVICVISLSSDAQIPLNVSLRTIGEAETVVGGRCTNYQVDVLVEQTSESSFENASYSVEVLFALAAKQILVTNTHTLSLRLCEASSAPSASSNASSTLQLLVHGATFNKNMWEPDYQPEHYSYVQHMLNEGYSTLAVDLPGNGNSSFPDGLLEAQTQTYVVAISKLIEQLRLGNAGDRSYSVGDRVWDRIVLVGFSIGGIVANSLAKQEPDIVDGIVLMGISWDLSWIYPAFLSGLQSSASLIDPARWGHLQPWYQTQANREGRLAACFYGDFDVDMAEHDWQTRDFDSLGAAITFTYHLVTAPAYTGPVFLGIGREDSTFCGGQRCIWQPYELYQRFPAASAHQVEVYEETGHLILYHNTAKQLMVDTATFLANNGF